MMNEVKLIRLTSGEEILCTIKHEHENALVMENPTIIIPTQERSIGLAPWMPYAKTELVEIAKSAIVFVIEPVDQLAEQYNSIHSRIITPNQRIIA